MQDSGHSSGCLLVLPKLTRPKTLSLPKPLAFLCLLVSVDWVLLSCLSEQREEVELTNLHKDFWMNLDINLHTYFYTTTFLQYIFLNSDRIYSHYKPACLCLSLWIWNGFAFVFFETTGRGLRKADDALLFGLQNYLLMSVKYFLINVYFRLCSIFCL